MTVVFIYYSFILYIFLFYRLILCKKVFVGYCRKCTLVAILAGDPAVFMSFIIHFNVATFGELTGGRFQVGKASELLDQIGKIY